MKRMHTATLTDSLAKEIPCQEFEYVIRDNICKKLFLRVQPAGAKSWIVRGRHRGKSVRVTLGSINAMDVVGAREKVKGVLAAKMHAKLPESESITLRDFSVIYEERWGPRWKTSTWRPYRSRLNSSILPAFGKCPIGLIEHADVARWFFSFSQKSPGNANDALGILRSMLNRAKEWGFLPASRTNPCKKIPKNRRKERGQPIGIEGLRRLGAALHKLNPILPDAVDAVTLLLFTGCRLDEIRSLKWEEIRGKQIYLSDSKVGERVVQLGRAAQMILSRRRSASISPFVFPSRINPLRAMEFPMSQWRRICKEADLPDDLRRHDLRHTFGTHSVESGESLLMTGALLGHKRTDSTAIYAHLSDGQVLQACERIAGTINEWMSVPDVSALRG